MSTYNERYDEALSKTSWVAKKASNGKTYLLKYAPHPERTGYLFAATDLETVHFEMVTAPSIPSRLAQILEREGRAEDADAINSLDFEDQQQRTEETLQQLSNAFDGAWAAVDIDLETDDYFDAVFVLRSPSLTWLFNVTEMRGRQPLSFISKHLLSPLASLLAQDRGVDTPRASGSSEAVAAVITDPGVARAVRRVTGGPPPASSRATPTPVKVSRPTSPTPKAKAKQRTPSPAPKQSNRRAQTPPRTISSARPATPERPAVAQSIPPLINPSSPTPRARKAYDYAAGLLPSSEPPSPGTSSTPAVEDRASPAPAPKQKSRAKSDDSSTPPSPRERHPPPVDKDYVGPAHPPSSVLDNPPSSTLDPLVPTQEKKKRKKRDKKEEETQEELEAEKRRADMKRRMAAGGGGRLGRRRL